MKEECSFIPPKQTFLMTGKPIQLLVHLLAFCIYGILEIKQRPHPQCKELIIRIFLRCFTHISIWRATK